MYTFQVVTTHVLVEGALLAQFARAHHTALADGGLDHRAPAVAGNRLTHTLRAHAVAFKVVLEIRQFKTWCGYRRGDEKCQENFVNQTLSKPHSYRVL